MKIIPESWCDGGPRLIIVSLGVMEATRLIIVFALGPC